MQNLQKRTKKISKILTLEILKSLQEKQKELDTLIHQKKNLSFKDTFSLRKIALFVEVGEMANEIQSFKYWKKEKKINLEKTKEETIDCLHFFLSLSNSSQIDFVNYVSSFSLNKYQDLNKILLTLFEKTKKLNFSRRKSKEVKIGQTTKNYYRWLQTFEKLCSKLEIDDKELVKNYSKKHTTNLQRQSEGY